MNRVSLVFFAVFALVARSDTIHVLTMCQIQNFDGTLRCYMCDTLTDASCDDPTKNTANSPPVECSLASINHWNTNMRQNPAFQSIAKIFEVDHPQQTQKLADVACAKMTVKLGPKNVTLRSCQSAKSPTLDVCRAINEQFSTTSSGYGQVVSMSFCDLCNTEACNGAVDVAPKTVQLLFGPIVLLVVQAYRHSFA